MSPTLTTRVAIVGGGPAGLMLAIELGAHGVPCVLLEEDPTPPTFPKANATSARTMEHFRRRGFADRVRASGLPDRRRQDVVYCTGGRGHELARFRIPSPAEARAGLALDYGVDHWPTPELPHRGQQMVIEPILLDEARRRSSVDVRMGARVTALREEGDHVVLQADVGGQVLHWQADYVVGCDGSRSLVREAMGVGYEGRGREEREFFGGQMLTIYFRSASLEQQLWIAPAWTYWVVNPTGRGVLIAINGVDTWVAGIQLKPGQRPEDVDVAATLQALVGAAVDFELIGTGAWLAGYMLVAERFRVGRCLIAGDAAHLFTPAAGMGYNTSIDDVVNLGWKLAAKVQGWGGEALLDSYDQERRAVAHRNTRFARQMADSMSALSPAPGLLDDTTQGAQARAQLGGRCLDHIRREFNTPGLQLGAVYASSVVLPDGRPPPPDLPNAYVASAHPGARAPHLSDTAAGPRSSLLDRFGLGFTLLQFAGTESWSSWLAAARSLGIPLTPVARSDDVARSLYDADLVLVRPDGHVAWRGPLSASPTHVLVTATGLTDPTPIDNNTGDTP